MNAIRTVRLALSLPYSFLLLAVALTTNEARAGEPGELSQALAMAETAYEQVEFGTTYRLACNGLQLGNATLQQTFRLHLLCATASAALEKTEEARAHFKIALAIRQDLHLERELSPKIRSPYLEAQGYWSHYEERLSLKATSRSNSRRLQLLVVDPAHLGSRVRVFWRTPEQTSFRSLEREAAPAVVVDINTQLAGVGIEYYATLIDERGNVIAELASEVEPQELAAQRTIVVPSTKAESVVRKGSAPESPPRWLPLTFIGVGIASAGAGVYFNVLRENAAHKWNGAECETPGLTRAEQCSSVDSDRRNAERAAIAFYATSGILLTTGISIWAIQASNHPVGHRASAEPARVSCGAAFPHSISCRGRF